MSEVDENYEQAVADIKPEFSESEQTPDLADLIIFLKLRKAENKSITVKEIDAVINIIGNHVEDWQKNWKLIEGDDNWDTLIAQRDALKAALEEMIESNKYARHISLRNESPRGSIWGDVRSKLDATRLKAESALALYKESEVKP